jgi:GxxExxY protein
MDNISVGTEDDAKKDPLTHAIIGAAIRVNKALGVGLLENPYEVFLCHELTKLKFDISRQPAMPIEYDGIHVELGFRPDIIVENKVIVELKTVAKFLPVHEAQLLTYLRFSGIRVGLLINFHAVPFISGIKRLVL